ncbi:flavin reductase family protein [Catenulispora pinistramenti]|uniref:flavin reductase family protein n=1 Tax=Catenulispora pinistramenti TaxID=2705254 RepID=UPI001E3E19D1|nr:flavin reductase family protein [Catenulispora pinistramenti]
MPAQATARERAGRVAENGGTAAGPAANAADGATIDAAHYRRVLGHFPSGVTVVASEDADGPVGFACQAFSALSLDPPLVLFSVGLTSTTWPRIEATGRFCVNFLAADHAELCRAFAVSGGDKFAGVDWQRSGLGSPILAGAHGWVDCTIEATHPGGDHTIVIGRVHALDADGESNPLIFHKGAFG